MESNGGNTTVLSSKSSREARPGGSVMAAHETALSSLQQGMVYHAATNPGHGIDIEQIQFSATSELDVDRLVAAFHTVNASHPELRTGFRWRGQPEPTRFVGVDLMPVEVITLHGRPEAEEVWSARVEADRLLDFDLAAPPLQRLLLANLGHDKGWRILWTFHHTILDGRSFSLVLSDLADCYRGVVQPPTRPSFDQHIASLTRANANQSEQRRFWSTYLQGVAADQGLSLQEATATDPGPRHDTIRFECTQFHLDEDQTSALSATAQSLACTMNVMVQAAWAILLHRHLGWNDETNDGETGQRSDVVFGTTRACRHLNPDADQMLGLLINTLPTRATITPTTTLGQLCGDLSRHQHNLRNYEATSLSDIKGYSGLGHDQELFASLVMYDDKTLNHRMASIDTGPMSNFAYKGQTNFPLALICYGGPQLHVSIEHDRSQIYDDAANQLSQRLRTILGALGTPGATRETMLSELAYLSEDDQRDLATWNDTDRPDGQDQAASPATASNATASNATASDATLIDLFDAQVERTPRAPALTFGQETLSYGQLKRLALDQADQLVEAGVGNGDVVAIVADRSLEMMVAIYGTLYAGAAYCPIDPDYPAERARFIIEQSQAKLVLLAGLADSQALASSRYGTTTETVNTITVDLEQLQGREISHRLPKPKTSDLAYVIYTSGSTGKPKGCANEHRGITNRLLWMQETFHLDHSDTVLQKTPFTFDVSVWELFWPLQVGASLTIAKPGDHKEPAKLAALIQRDRVTTIHFVPSMLRAFVDGLADKKQPLADQCRSLRRVVCSGEALPKDLADECIGVLDAQLHNLYGPTEAAVDVTWHHHQAGSDLSFVPIGAAIANTRIVILDRMLQPVPPGVAGELFIAGVQVCRGYLGRPDLTAERFIPEVSSASMRTGSAMMPGSDIMYRTGDLGRHLPDGQIQYLGRTDHQVKIRGFRIELGEIEVALSTHPAIAHCVVIDRELGKAGRQLVAYLVHASPDEEHTAPANQRPTDQEIRHHLLASLADYMVPNHLVWLDALPLSAAGKVDRKALPEPAVTVTRGLTSNSPLGEREEVVAQIWRGLTDIESVGRDVPFFAAGGHSLLAIALAVRLSEVAGREITVTDILDAPTVADQAELLAKSDDDLVIDLRDTAHSPDGNVQRRRAVAQRKRRQATRQVAGLESLDD